MSTFIDIHVIQTLPSSNINRDDTGRPKTAIFGGAARARVSSQAWKRATRQHFSELLPDAERAVRTRRILADIVGGISKLDPTIEQEEAIALATSVLTAAGITVKPPRPKKPKKGEEPEPADPFGLSEYLLFVSNHQIEQLSQLAVDSRGAKPDRAAAKQAINAEHGVEVALFGRMVADDKALNVDASVQVAHAFSTHVVEPEYDYYTAVDDRNLDSDAGAGMIGVVEFNSSTLYRYATINLEMLQANLGDVETTAHAAGAFVQSFVVSMPSGKQNSFANGTLPEAVLVQVRPSRPINLSGAFETPVQAAADRAISTTSVERLAERSREVDEAYGTAPALSLALASNGKVRKALDGVGEPVTLDDIVGRVRAEATDRLAELV